MYAHARVIAYIRHRHAHVDELSTDKVVRSTDKSEVKLTTMSFE